MGWQDRDYGRRGGFGGGQFSNPLMNLLFGSVPLGRWFGIRVRVHASLLWVLGFRLFSAGTVGWMEALSYSILLFAIILLHEFGHCLGSWMTGGQPQDLLLWPLGGLATTESRHAPWPRFVTVVCGPLVNVILLPILGTVFYLYYHQAPPMDPLFPWVGGSALMKFANAHPDAFAVYFSPVGKWLWWAYSINFSLLVFNLIPMYPLDGGKLLQISLWKLVGYGRSMRISCITGMVLAVLVGTVGLISGAFMVLGIGMFGFYQCMMELRMLKETEVEGDVEPYDLSAAWDNPEKPRAARRKGKKRWLRLARKRATKDQAEQAKIDLILVKVKEKGLHSLSWWEKRTLKKATERQRQQDLAERF